MNRNAEILAAIRERGEPLRRECVLTSGNRSIDIEARTVELSVSSEVEVERWFGSEILDHSAKAVRLERFRNDAALLLNHDHCDQVGKIDRAELAGDKLRATVRFSRSARGEEIFQDVQDGIRTLVSIGYRIHGVESTKQQGGLESVRVVDWEPYEVSFVSIPADTSVGVGRSQTETQEKQILCSSEQFNSHPIRLALPAHLQVVGLRPSSK